MDTHTLTEEKKRDLLRRGFTQDEIHELEIQLDPVKWCEAFLNDPNNPKKTLKLRWYQKEMIRYQGPRKTFRAGRRVGKSVILCVEMLWKAFCNKNKRILVCAPYKIQVQNLWKDGFNRLIQNSDVLEQAIIKTRANPYEIEFNNGSRILGLTAGSSTGNKGSAIRGSNASDLYLDEVDYMGDAAIQSIMAIIATEKNTTFCISSTPTGKREFFYDCCTRKSLGYKEFHFPSSVSPEWTSIEEAKKNGIDPKTTTEYLFRNSNPESVYEHEYLATWGSEEQGVFKHHFIDRSLYTYPPKVETVDPLGLKWSCGDSQNSENVYSMGVDWNGDAVGTQIVITEYLRKPKTLEYMEEDEGGTVKKISKEFSNRYRLFYRESVSLEKMTQTESIKRIIRLNNQFKIDHIYVDSGFGHCVHPDTLINVSNGVKKIKDIKKGDKVLTHLGIYDKVYDKVFSNNKEAYEITPSKCFSTKVSWSHPFLIYKSENRFKNKKYKKTLDSDIDEKNLEWKTCKEIDPNKDFIAIAKSKNTRNDDYIIDLYDLLKNENINIKYDNKYIWEKNSYNVKDRCYLSKSDICKTCGVSKSVVGRCKRKIKNKEKYFTFSENKCKRFVEKNKPTNIKINRYINITSEDFLKIYGWYLSEGNCNKSSVEFTQYEGTKHKDFMELLGYIKNIFPNNVLSIYKRRGNGSGKKCTRLFINGIIVSKLFEKIGGKLAENKFIYEEVLRRPKKCGKLIKTLILGDGCYRKKQSLYTFTTVSFSLGFQMRQILIDNSILPNIYYMKKSKINYKDQMRLDISGNSLENRKFKSFTGLKLEYSRTKKERRKFFETNNYFLVPIRKFKNIGNTNGLIDIGVKNSKSFCGNGIILHNSNIEELKLYGMKYRESGILGKIKDIEFNSHVFVYDPYTKEKKKKATKPFMVNNAVTCLERNEIILPDSEDEKVKLIGQMREYKVERYSPTGVPTYSKGNDHILDAFMLSLLAFQIEYSELVNVKYTDFSLIVDKPSLLMPGIDKVNNRTEELDSDKKTIMGAEQRAPKLGADSYTRDSRAKYKDFEELTKKRGNKRSPFSFNFGGNAWSKLNSPKRSNF